MSAIVYRDGVLAADSRAYSGTHRPLGKKLKVRRYADGTLVGVATSTPGLAEWLLDEWWANGRPEVASFPQGCEGESFSLLAVAPDGSARYANDALVLSGPIEAPYFAIGSAGSYALGALAYGASAVEAALIGADLDPLCGRPVASVLHDSEEVSWHS